MLKGLAEVTYFVPDIEKAWAWLQEALAADLIVDLPGMIQARIGTSVITLHPADIKGQAGPGGQVAYWHVASVDDALRHFESHGGRRYRGPIHGVDGPRIAQVLDPFGNVWGLIER